MHRKRVHKENDRYRTNMFCFCFLIYSVGLYDTSFQRVLCRLCFRLLANPMGSFTACAFILTALDVYVGVIFAGLTHCRGVVGCPAPSVRCCSW